MRPQSNSVRAKIVLFGENAKLMVIKLISSFYFVKTHSNCNRSKIVKLKSSSCFVKTQSNCDRVKIVDLKSCISLATKRWIPLDCLGQQHSLCKFTKSFWLSSFRLDEFRWELRIKPESVNVDVILLDFHLEIVSVRRNF